MNSTNIKAMRKKTENCVSTECVKIECCKYQQKICIYGGILSLATLDVKMGDTLSLIMNSTKKIPFYEANSLSAGQETSPSFMEPAVSLPRS
jgi:hypothetical protein